MVAKGFKDGPVASDCESLGAKWDEFPILRQRARDGKKLVLDVTGQAEVQASSENLKLNSEVLEAVLSHMLSRGRVGADPIGHLWRMAFSFYTFNKQLYTSVGEKGLKAWAYQDAWGIRKMISRLRQNLGKHESMRVSRNYWPVFVLHQLGFQHGRDLA